MVIAMDKVQRFSVSIEPELLASFDEHIAAKGYSNRSEAIRDMIRAAIVKEKWSAGKETMAGTITMVYEHDVPGLTEKLMQIQHSHHAAIHSATHVHMDEDNCLEVLVVTGKPKGIIKLADSLRAVKGVHHSELVMTSKALSSHAHGNVHTDKHSHSHTHGRKHKH